MRAITNRSGTIITSIDYYPFGEQMQLTGTSSRFSFNGKEYDDSYGFDLYYYGARYMSPSLGRFVTPDPVHDFLNPYSYVGNNPMNRIDPTGMRTFPSSNGFIQGPDYMTADDRDKIPMHAQIDMNRSGNRAAAQSKYDLLREIITEAHCWAKIMKNRVGLELEKAFRQGENGAENRIALIDEYRDFASMEELYGGWLSMSNEQLSGIFEFAETKESLDKLTMKSGNLAAAVFDPNWDGEGNLSSYKIILNPATWSKSSNNLTMMTGFLIHETSHYLFAKDFGKGGDNQSQYWSDNEGRAFRNMLEFYSQKENVNNINYKYRNEVNGWINGPNLRKDIIWSLVQENGL